MPPFYPVHLVDNGLCQGNRRTTGRIFLFGMVYFFQTDLIVRLSVHYFGQEPVKLEEDINPDTVIGGIKKAPAFGQGQPFYLGFPLQPACSTRYYRDLTLYCPGNIIESGGGFAKLYGHINAVGVQRIQLLPVINIYLSYYGMAPAFGDF